MKELVLNVEGMMCSGCENRVKTIDGVENVVANHVNGTVTVTLNKELDEKIITDKLSDIGYEVK